MLKNIQIYATAIRIKHARKIVNRILRIINRIGIINRFYSPVTLHN